MLHCRRKHPGPLRDIGDPNHFFSHRKIDLRFLGSRPVLVQYCHHLDAYDVGHCQILRVPPLITHIIPAHNLGEHSISRKIR